MKARAGENAGEATSRSGSPGRAKGSKRNQPSSHKKDPMKAQSANKQRKVLKSKGTFHDISFRISLLFKKDEKAKRSDDKKIIGVRFEYDGGGSKPNKFTVRFPECTLKDLFGALLKLSRNDYIHQYSTLIKRDDMTQTLRLNGMWSYVDKPEDIFNQALNLGVIPQDMAFYCQWLSDLLLAPNGNKGIGSLTKER